MNLKQALNKIKQIVESNSAINLYYFGDILDYTVTSNTQNNVMVCTLTGATVSRVQCQLNLTFYFLDLCEEDNRTKETEVWSDQLLILQDTIALLRAAENDWDISELNTVTFFVERFENSISGCQTDIKITFDYEPDRCTIPNT